MASIDLTTEHAVHDRASDPTGSSRHGIDFINALPSAALVDHADALRQAFIDCREHTLRLAAPLSAEDMQIQSMPDASPTKWHLGHTTWFFETFILQPQRGEASCFDEAFQVLFNSYYQSVGAQHRRAERGLLSRPSLERVLAYREAIDREMVDLLEGRTGDAGTPGELSAGAAELIRLGIHHEQQHQELLITDIKHALSRNPLLPAYDAHARPPRATQAEALRWLPLDEGPADIGYAGEGFHFDNEGPRHRHWLHGGAIADKAVTNGQWLEFMADGGYEDTLLWLDEGWAWRQAQGIEAPLYWQRRDGDWSQFTLRGEQAIDPKLPVAHVSYFEAEAFARWAGARLPTEFEWEAACGRHDLLPGGYEAPVAAREFLRNWEWTASAYLPYPGFAPPTGAVGEYNGKFMINQMVLKGASAATSQGHSRLSYRNFFPTAARWQYSGLRLVRGKRAG